MIKKRKFIAVFCLAGILMTSVMVNQSNAIFGLSKCEKVKKQVSDNEFRESFYQAAFEPANGVPFINFTFSDYDYFVGIWSDLVSWEVKMYQYDQSNSSCFTASQRKYIAKVLPLWMSANVSPTHGLSGSNFDSVTWGSIYKQ